jgi:hypothetical protein
MSTTNRGENKMSNLRNAQLLQQVGAHPLKASLAKALDVAENFQGDVQFLQLDKNLSEQGRENQRSAKLRAAIRDLRDARAPLDEMQKKLDIKRKAVSLPPTDPKDILGFLKRQELRATLRSMDPGQRAVLIEDPQFADAMLEQPPALSGLLPAEKFIVDAAREKRLTNLYGPQLQEIAALETTVAEARAIADVARNDLKLHSAMDDRTFTEFVRPIENRQGAPWLVKNGDAVMRVRPEMRGSPQLHQPATADEIREGVFYDSEAAYLASRAA